MMETQYIFFITAKALTDILHLCVRKSVFVVEERGS